MPDGAERAIDVICLGRAAVDLYGGQVGGRLEDMSSFRKYLGGSSGNLAAGLARLGKRSAMLTRVGDEHMGRFVREALEREGVDVGHVISDPDRLTGLVVLGIDAGGESPHIFFRERCADMGLCEADIQEEFIASARMLAITGTHLSTRETLRAVMRAVAHAKQHGTQVVLDIDYRPVLWGLKSHAEGASRFETSERVSGVIGELLAYCDLLVGTEEEIAIAGGHVDLAKALCSIREVSEAWIVLKRGPDGCVIFRPGPINDVEDGAEIPGLPVEVFNTLGAGDGFLAGFLAAWLEKRAPEECGRFGNACGALVVSRHGCTPAIPSRVELEAFMERKQPPSNPRFDPELVHLHRVTTWKDDPRPLCILAFDHRRQFEELASSTGRPFEDIVRFKAIIAAAVLDVTGDGHEDIRTGVIRDEQYGGEAEMVLSGSGLWTARPVEVPASRPLTLWPRNEIGLHLDTWPARDIVKVLLFYHPDDDIELRLGQEERLAGLFDVVVDLDRRMLLEVICPDNQHEVDDHTLARTMRRFYNLGIRPDWWKIKPPRRQGWEAITEVIESCDPHCKGVVLLGLDAGADVLRAGFEAAEGFTWWRGFAVGRSIFRKSAQRWFDGEIDDSAAQDEIAEQYRMMISAWREAASPVPALARATVRE